MSANEIAEIRIDDIFLDEENPRLPTTVGKSQAEMILYIARNTSITELMTAIAENGYFPGEPIVVIPRPAGGYWAVEGNRRLTALKLLSDPSLYPNNARVQSIAETAQNKPQTVPCVLFQLREQVVNYLGYRHITGVKQWEPLSKARYISMYFDTQTNKSLSPIERYREVARAIGSQYSFIKRQLDGFALFRFIENRDFFGIEKLTEESISFSLLSTAVGYESILSYVSSSQNPYLEPDNLKADELRNLTEWLFSANSEGETTLGDSRNIQRLAVILADREATKILANGSSLSKAYAQTKGVSVEFNDLLSEISTKISEAVASVALVELDESHAQKIGDIFKQARALRVISEEPR